MRPPSQTGSLIPRTIAASLLYAGLVLLMTWPGAKTLQKDLMGGGDAFEFVWGLWWFGEALQNPLLSVWHSPLMIYPVGANLIQHDYPMLSNAVAWLLRESGMTLIGSYNVCLLLAFWLNALAAFLLADAVLSADRESRRGDFLPPFIAGTVFCFAPFFYCVSLGGQLSYVNAYSLPMAALCLHEARRTGARWWFLGAGASLVVAAWCSSYYAVYVLTYIAVFYLYGCWEAKVAVDRRPRFSSFWFRFWAGLGGTALAAAIALWILNLAGKGGIYTVLGRPVSLRGTANPMIAWWLSWGAAFFTRFRLSLQFRRRPGWTGRGLLKEWGWIALPLIALAPYFIRAAQLVLTGEFGKQDVGWKTGPSGAYPASAFLPNVYHTVWGLARHGTFFFRRYFDETPIGLGWTVLAVVWAARPWRTRRWWAFAFLFFLVMSFGPFLKFIPGLDSGPVLPVWFFRHIPVLSEARMPMRWVALALVAWTVLAAYGFQALRSRKLRLLCLFAVLGEAFVVPFRTSDPSIPPAYVYMDRDPGRGALLELPFNVNDARKGWGDTGGYPDVMLYYQTHHQRPIVGGSIARLPESTFKRFNQEPVLQAFASWKNRTPGPELTRRAFGRWAREWRVSWVILDKSRTHEELSTRIWALLGTPAYEDSTHAVWPLADASPSKRSSGGGWGGNRGFWRSRLWRSASLHTDGRRPRSFTNTPANNMSSGP